VRLEEGISGEFCFPKKAKKQQSMSALSSTARNKTGRPTKKTPARCQAILKGIESGWPYVVACASAGTTYESFSTWCRTDEHFAAQVAMAEAVAIRTNLELIQDAARDKIWPAAAWLLERRHPELFSRPEVQLNLIQQNNINTQGSNGHSLESIIVSDLEFLKLREHENYKHRAHERQAREVEAEVVPVDLSGTLAVQSHPGASVISETQAEATQRRVRKADSKIDELLRTKQAGNGNGASLESTPSQMVLAPIVMPAEPVPTHWWAQLSQGSGEREVERATAIKLVRTILADVFGQLRSQNTPVEFVPGAAILLRDVHSAIQALCGADGWAALRRRGEV
jgi:hypothetical protein